MQTSSETEQDSQPEKDLQPENSQLTVAEKPVVKAKPKKKIKPWLMGVVAAGLVGVAVLAVVLKNNAPKVDINALTVPVEAKQVTVRISSSGSVQPVQRVNLSPKNSGRLAELFVEQGDRVQQGQVIARMESDDIQAQLAQAEARLQSAKARLAKQEAGNRPSDIAQAEARLEQARASLEQVRAGTRSEEIAEAQAGLRRARAQVEEGRSRLELATNNVRRTRPLVAQGALAAQELDRALDEQRRAEASLEQIRAGVTEAEQRLGRLENGSRPEEISKAEAIVAEAQSNLDGLLNGARPEDIAQARAEVGEIEAQVRYYEVQLEETKVRAPFAGIITQRYAIEGSFVTPATSASDASSATSTSIVALAKDLEVLAKVPEADISQIKAGQTVEIVADAYPGEVFKGNVKLVAPEAVKERDVTLFQVRIEMKNGKDKLQSGMNVDLQFLGAELNNALVVPTVAIVTNRGQTGVLIPDDKNQPKFQPVTTGTTIQNQIQILEGVKAGERVFLELPKGKKLEDIVKNK